MIERRSREDVAFRILATNLSPDHVTIARFRRRHADALSGASGAGTWAERRARFDRAEKRLAQERPVPATTSPESVRPTSNKAKGRRLAAERKGTRNITDPDSRVMKARRGWVQGYNAQVAVNEDHVIVACEVSNAVNDHRLLEPMVAAARGETSAAGSDSSGAGPIEFIADAGYWNGEAVERLAAQGERMLVPPNGRPRTRGVGGSPTVTKMTDLLAEPDTALRYRRRQALVEPVIAHVKCNRRLDRFLLRGQPEPGSSGRSVALRTTSTASPEPAERRLRAPNAPTEGLSRAGNSERRPRPGRSNNRPPSSLARTRNGEVAQQTRPVFCVAHGGHLVTPTCRRRRRTECSRL